MSSSSSHLSSFRKGIEALKLDGKGRRIVIISARWNEVIIHALVDGARTALLSNGVSADDIVEIKVPGSYELPFATKSVIEKAKADKERLDAVIAIGVLIKGETMHFEYICESTSHGLREASLESGIPVIFGVLTCLTDDQAKSRAGLIPGGHNHGSDWGRAAIEMSTFKWTDTQKPIKAKL